MVQRLTSYAYLPGIEEAKAQLPQGIAERLAGVHYWTEIDPVYAGIGDYSRSSNALGNRSYRNTSHVLWAHNSIDKRSTICLLTPEPWYVVIHELGHVLDEQLGWEHIAEPVTEYAKFNREEAFAEAFTGWLCAEGTYGKRIDEATRALFDSLAGNS